MSNELNAEIIGRLIGSPGGIYGEELGEIAPDDYREQIKALEELGAEITYAEDPGGRKYCTLKNPGKVQEILLERSGRKAEESPQPSGAEESQPPAPPPSSSPPAETPAAEGLTATEKEDLRRIGYNLNPLHQTHFIARSIRVDARKITLIPSDKADAQIALGFAMDVPVGSRIHVYMDIVPDQPEEGEPEKPTEKGDEMPKDPKDMKGVNVIVKPSKEKDPTKKSKQQLDEELSEQVRDGEISTGLADAQAKIAGL